MSTKYCALCRARTSERNVAVPKDESRRELWSMTTGVKFSASSKICCKHFKDSDFFYYPSENATKRRRLMKTAVPQKPEAKPIFTEHIPSACGDNLYDFNSQTEKTVIEAGIALENLRLNAKITELERENVRLTKQMEDMRTLIDSMHELFTESQVKFLKNGGHRVQWHPEDISKAMCLKASGPRLYQHLHKKGFPFPSVQTLRKWERTLEIKPGPLDFAIGLLENAVDIDDDDKICVLFFDKMVVEGEYVQVAMVQGLRKSWKQTIYYDYNNAMTRSTVYELIRKLYIAGYYVVAMASDIETDNYNLWLDLGVSTKKSWFKHPANDDMKIFVFADVLHLMAQLRKNFLETGFMINGNYITSAIIKETVNHHAFGLETSNLKINYEHLDVQNTDVKLAIQLFSNTTANAIREYSSLEQIVENANETSHFIQLVNDWFDIFNVNLCSIGYKPTQQQFGKELDAQQKVLNEMTSIMSTLLVENDIKCLPFQEAIIISNNSLELLHNYLAEKYGMEYVITKRISKEELKYLFEPARKEDNLQNLSCSNDFKNRLRKNLLGIVRNIILG